MSESLLLPLFLADVEEPDVFPVFVSDVLLPVLEEPAFAFVEVDFDPVAEADVLLLPLLEEVEPDVELDPEPAPDDVGVLAVPPD